MGKVLFLWFFVCSALVAQWWAPPPHPTGLPGQPFSIRHIWYVGGQGPWDTITLDPGAEQLYIARGKMVQVVSIQTGTVSGEITGLVGARAIALDDKGEYGYISDGPGNRVVVLDRRTLQTAATIATEPDPRSLVYEPSSGLVFVVTAAPAAQPPPPPQHGRPQAQAAPNPYSESYITVIDPQNDSVLGNILIAGHLGFAQADGAGNVYVGYTDRDAILRFNAEAVAADLQNRQAEPANPSAAPTARHNAGKAAAARPPLVDWTVGPDASADQGGGYRVIRLAPACGLPRGFAVDGHDARLFAACQSMTLEVLNTSTGLPVTTLPIGVSVDEIGFDPVHGYIFAADGAQDGTLTIIRRNFAADTYAIVQNLPTRQRAFVMAVDPESGELYLVTDILGADLTRPGGIGELHMKPINGSFQVIEIGN